MPSSQQILDALTATANEWVSIAIIWHMLIASTLIALAGGWRPTDRSAMRLLALLPASVAAFSLLGGNPFNAITFLALTAALLSLAQHELAEPIERSATWSWTGGIFMLAFGWTYPHFLHAHPIAYLVAAPVGLVPCPTLAVLIGLALLHGDRLSRATRLTLASFALFYGLFGIFRLGVTLDAGLLLGSAVLAASAWERPRLTHRLREAHA